MKNIIKKIKNEPLIVNVLKDLVLIALSLYGVLIAINILYCLLGKYEWSDIFIYEHKQRIPNILSTCHEFKRNFV